MFRAFKKLLVAVLFVTGLSSTVFGQRYLLQHYTRQDGLLNNNVFRTFQDSKGFMWFSTYGGLNRFDGKAFHRYNDSLTIAPILSVSETGDGGLLACNYIDGLVLLDNKGIRRVTPGRQELPDKAIYASNKDEVTWFIAKRPLSLLFRIYRDKLSQIDLRDRYGKQIVFNKIIQSGNEVLATSSDGIYHLEDTSVTALLPDLIAGDIVDVRSYGEGVYWVGKKNKVIKISGGKIEWTFNLHSNRALNTMLLDRSGNLWVSLTDKGVLLIQSRKVVDITKRLGIEGTLINDLYEDREGNIWISTYTDGVYRVNTLAILNYTRTNSPIGIYCSSIIPMDSHRLFLGSSGRVSIWDSGRIVSYPVSSLKGGYFVNFLSIINGKLYIGTPYGMIEKEMQGEYKEHFVESKQEGDPIFGTLSLLQDSKGRIWVGGFTSLFQLTKGKLVQQTEALLKRRFNTIYEDRKGNVLFGTDSGLIIYDGVRYIHQYFPLNRAINGIYRFHDDGKGRLWIATVGGIVRLENGRYTVLKIGEGFLSNKCNDLEPDGSGNLWVATYNGLAHLNVETLQIKEFLSGLYQNEMLELFTLREGRLFAGNVDGLSVVNTHEMYVNNNPPPVYITEVRTERQQIAMADSVQLGYNHSKLTIDYTGVNYQYANLINYRYQIKPLDDGWHYTQNSSIEMPSFHPGHYTMEVQARLGNGAWGESDMLVISVPTPFWMSRWFLVVTICSTALLLFAFTRGITVRRELKKRRQLSTYNKIVYLKQQALSALMNPHFIFNCMNSIQHFLNRKENELANTYLADFATLIRLTMDDAQDAFILLEKEIRRIELYLSLEQLRFGDDLQYFINVEPGLETGRIRIPNMILQPYIENAIWHGIMPRYDTGIIEVSFAKDGSDLTIRIEDNGVGFDGNEMPLADGKQHMGMKFTRERLSLLNNLLNQYYAVEVRERTTNGEVSGTIVQLRVPLHSDELVINKIEKDLNDG